MLIYIAMSDYMTIAGQECAREGVHLQHLTGSGHFHMLCAKYQLIRLKCLSDGRGIPSLTWPDPFIIHIQLGYTKVCPCETR